MSSFVVLVLFAVACITVGLAALWFLVKQRRWWPACFLTAAYGAALYIVYATLLTASSDATPLLSMAAVTCAYATLMTAAISCTQSPTLKDRAVLSVSIGVFGLLLLFIASVSMAHFGRQAFAALGAALTLGVLLGATAVGNLVFSRRSPLSVGAQTTSHLLHYVGVIAMLILALDCQSERDALTFLLLATTFTSAGAAGVVYEADKKAVKGGGRT